MHQNLIETIAFLASFTLVVGGLAFLFSDKASNIPLLKTLKESSIAKIAASGAFALIAWFLPWISLKVLFLALAFVLPLSIFPLKKTLSPLGAVILIFFLIIIALGLLAIPVVFGTYSNILKIATGTLPQININIPPIDISNSSEDVVINRLDKKVLPDTEIPLEDVQNIQISTYSGMELEFTKTNTIEIPSDFVVKKEEENLILSELSQKNVTYVIKVGILSPKNLKINCSGIKITGKADLKDFSLNCNGAKMNADITSEKETSIHCSGLNLTGKLRGENLNIDADGINMSGELYFDKISINSSGINIHTSAKFNDFKISSSGFNGTIEILNSSNERGNLLIDSDGGLARIINKNNAPVEIKTHGFIKLVKE